MFKLLTDSSHVYFWILWAVILVWQNYAFTRVSRARNSGSLKAHALAAIQSNGVWFVQSLFAVSSFMGIIKGEYGFWKAALAIVYYTVFTMSGSLYAHYTSLKKEAGATAVGASKKYAQIAIADWDKVKALLAKEEAAVKAAL